MNEGLSALLFHILFSLHISATCSLFMSPVTWSCFTLYLPQSSINQFLPPPPSSFLLVGGRGRFRGQGQGALGKFIHPRPKIFFRRPVSLCMVALGFSTVLTIFSSFQPFLSIFSHFQPFSAIFNHSIQFLNV